MSTTNYRLLDLVGYSEVVSKAMPMRHMVSELLLKKGESKHTHGVLSAK